MSELDPFLPSQEFLVARNSGDNGPATLSQIAFTKGVAVSPLTGEVYFSSKFKVMKVLLNGTLVTVAGNGLYNYTGDNGLATQASLKSPSCLAFMSNGDLLIVDNGATLDGTMLTTTEFEKFHQVESFQRLKDWDGVVFLVTIRMPHLLPCVIPQVWW